MLFPDRTGHNLALHNGHVAQHHWWYFPRMTAPDEALVFKGERAVLPIHMPPEGSASTPLRRPASCLFTARWFPPLARPRTAILHPLGSDSFCRNSRATSGPRRVTPHARSPSCRCSIRTPAMGGSLCSTQPSTTQPHRPTRRRDAASRRAPSRSGIESRLRRPENKMQSSDRPAPRELTHPTPNP
eukprot:scaffold2252_cov118-Isochrysis_galbana.AAC.3